MPLWVLVALGVRALRHDVRDGDDSPEALDGPDVQRRVAASVGAAAVASFGAILLAAVALLSGATADAAIAAGSEVSTLTGRAPGFILTDGHGRTTSLADFTGRVVVLAFIDPVCTSECPIEAQEMRAASDQLGPDARVSFVAINANPRFTSVADVAAFTRAEGLASWGRWTYLTGSVAELRSVWRRYGVSVSTIGAGGMAMHSEPIFIIDRRGRLRVTWTLAAGEGPSSVEGQSTTSQIVDQVRRAS